MTCQTCVGPQGMSDPIPLEMTEIGTFHVKAGMYFKPEQRTLYQCPNCKMVALK